MAVVRGSSGIPALNVGKSHRNRSRMAKRPLIYDSEDEDEEDELHLAPIARIQETAATTPPVFIDLSASSPLSQPGETVHASTGSTGVFDQLLQLLHKTRLISVAFEEILSREIHQAHRALIDPTPDAQHSSTSLKTLGSPARAIDPHTSSGDRFGNSVRQSADIGGVRTEPGGSACNIAFRPQAAERYDDGNKASGSKAAGILNRRRPSESRREKDEWAVTSSEASDEDHLSGRGKKQISRVRKRIASRGAILGRSATFGRQIIAAGLPLPHNQTEDEDSDEWRPKGVLTFPNNTSGARSAQGSLRPEIIEGLSKRKRPRSGLLCAELNPEERKHRKRPKAEIPESSKLKSTDSSIIVDLRDSKLSSSQRGHYEIISNATSSAAESANPPGKRTTAVASSRPASESIGSMAPKSKKRKRKTARSPSADSDIAVAHPVTESVEAASNDDDLHLAQSRSVAAPDKLHSNISREGSPQLSAASLPTSKGRKVAKRRTKVGSEDDYIAGEESDFEPANRTTKAKTKKGRKSRKDDHKVTKSTKQSSGSTEMKSTRVNDKPEKTLFRDIASEEGDLETEPIGPGPPSSTPLMAKDVNMAPSNKTIAAATECRMVGVEGQDDKVAMAESLCPAQATSTAIVSPIAAGNSVSVDRKSGSDRKIAYRVGLSKSARIQPLLRIMRK